VNIETVRDILARIRHVKIAVYGDFCLDAYWTLLASGSEVSVETGQNALAVEKHRYSLGGAGNVVANLAALEPEKIAAIGVIGPDIFGREIVRQLEAMGVDVAGMVVQPEGFDTMAYCKQVMDHDEKARVDFGVVNRRTDRTDQRLLTSLREAFKNSDVILLNQQVSGSITNEAFISGVNKLVEEFPKKIVILDSRHYQTKFKKTFRKLNQQELAALNNVILPKGEMLSLHDLRRFTAKVFKQSRKPLFVTRGARGIFAYDSAGEHEVPGIQVPGAVDPVGAGDTVLSAVASCLAAGIDTESAADFAGLAAGVTVQKLLQTGTAGGAEILSMARDADYVYQSELAEDHVLAKYHDDSEIEICCNLESLPHGGISHVVFDNDGTLSVLRHGWEGVMERVMVKLILGERYCSVPEGVQTRVRGYVRDYIERSAGTQTIVQMDNLVAMIKSFGLVPQEKIRDKSVYRDIYYKALMEQPAARMLKLRNGELSPEDCMIKGALHLLKTLRDRGLTLYLASGANSRDVVDEAKAMGYADFFNGGIYGASDELSMHSKKIVMDNIIRDNHLTGKELVCFGDGPVEMRQCRKQGGLAIGLATDEVVRYGLNLVKRTRLIKAGAQIVVPDFSQGDALIRLLFEKRMPSARKR
jgi:rfaE bifunctional protein kinase chain/domain